VAVEHPPFANGSLGPPFNLEQSEVEALFGKDFKVKIHTEKERLIACLL
jgi:hypothetical protein